MPRDLYSAELDKRVAEIEARTMAEIRVLVEPLPDEIVHFTEYNDGGIALCGENLEDAEEADGPVPDSTMCAECVVIHTAEDVLSG